MDYLIRRATSDDALTLAGIQTASWRSAFQEILEPEVLERCTDPDRAFNMYSRLLQSGKGNGYLGLLEGRPHCIAWWDFSREDDMPDYAEIICIHSLPENWRKGCGGLMMKRLLKDIAEERFQKIMLWVFTQNTRARAFYEANGFRPSGKTKSALGTEEMCYVLEFKPELELLTRKNLPFVRAIHREDISEDWVDSADTLMEYTEYAFEHLCKGHTYAIKYGPVYIGVILLGEAIPWQTDPPEMNKEPFYRLMGFVLDARYRKRGLGGKILEDVISRIYREYGVRPIALGVHRANTGAARFYERHGFQKTAFMEGNDLYYLRYPEKTDSELSG